MIITQTKTWEKPEDLQGLLFFCQRILELSYDKSDFKGKNVSLFIREVIKEALELFEFNIRHGNEIDSHDFNLLLDEIKSKIKNDHVLKEILGDKREYYLNRLNTNTDQKTLKNTLEVLNLKVHPREYFYKSKEKIKSLLPTKKFKELYQATTRLFEFLIWYGYQKGTIYFLINRRFFDRSGKEKVKSFEDVDDFFDLFDLKVKEFEVVFVGSKLFNEIQDSCAQFNLKIILERDAKYDQNLESKFFRNKNHKKVFLVCEKIKAVDYLHAMKVAERKISLVADLFVVFHHKHKPWHSDYCLVFKHDKENVVTMKKPNNIMSNVSEGDFSTAKEIFPIFLKRFNLEKDSFNRFNRGVELHSLSLETDEVASQILNFWICLETLLITEKGKSHITSVSQSLELIQRHHVLSGKIENFKDLLLQWDKDCIGRVKGDLPDSFADSNDEEIVAALICVDKFKAQAEKLLAEMSEQPLLRFKFMSLVGTMQSSKDINKLIEEEISLSKSEIRRVYRSRNKIVHQGNISGHSEFIAEVAHYYLDLVLFSIIERKIAFNDIRSIDNFINELKISIDCHKKYISDSGDKKLEEANFKNVIFGSES